MSSSTPPLQWPLPQPGDVLNLMLQVDGEGGVHISLVAFSKGIPAAAQPSAPAAKSEDTSVPDPLSPHAVPHPRVRVLGHTRSETKDGTPFVVYIVEYVASPSAKPAVTSVRFSDAYGLHRLLSLRFACLPPFPSRTLLRSLSDAQLVREREEALGTYLQLVALRADIRRHGELERWLGIADATAANSGVATEERREREKSDSEHEKDVDARMKQAEAAAAARREEERRAAEAASQRFDLLIDQFHVIHTQHVDIDALKEVKNKEHEMRQTAFASSPAVVSPSASASAASSAVVVSSSSFAVSATASLSAPLAAANLSFLTRSPTFTVHRALLPSAGLLFVACGDESRLAKLDHWISGLFSSWTQRQRDEEKRERERVKRERFVNPEEEAKAERQRELEQREAEYPLGALYAFSRQKDGEAWQPTLSLFFERELSELLWDDKRRWCWLLTDDGQVHVYAPVQQPDWSHVRKVWTIQLHNSRIHRAVFVPSLDCLLSISGDENVTRFDVASLSITAAAPCPSPPTCLAYDSAYDRVFLSHADSSISVLAPGSLSLRRHRVLSTIRLHRAAVRCLVYHEGQRLLASGDDSGAVLISEPGRPGEEAEAKLKSRVFGHEARITWLGFSAGDGDWLLSGDADGKVQLTSRESGCPVLALQAHDKPVLSIAMFDRLLVTTSQDRTCKVWQLQA